MRVEIIGTVMEGKVEKQSPNISIAEKVCMYLREDHRVTKLLDVTEAYRRKPHEVIDAVTALNRAGLAEYQHGSNAAKAAMRKALGLES